MAKPQAKQQPKPKPAPRPREVVAEGPPRSGRVALIGRPNVGKSTILNAALEQPLAIVSPIPQTTRDSLLGVVHRGSAEIALLDTPGLHRPHTELGRVMNQSAREEARSADVVVFVTDIPQDTPKRPRRGEEPGGPRLKPHPGDVALLADIGAGVPTILVVNKIDRVKDKGALLPLLEALGKLRDFTAIVPISALRKNDVPLMLDEIAKHLPEGPWQFGEDEITDRPTRFFAAEYVREQILRATQAEVPHAAAVTIDGFVEPPGAGAVHIDATIYVERPGQKRILIGTAGEMLKRIGTQARLRIEELIGRKVNLKLWVRVTPAWRESPSHLADLGYRTRQGDAERIAMVSLEAESSGDDDDPETEEP